MHQVADLKLRGRNGPLPARLYWPEPVSETVPRPLLVFFPGADAVDDGEGICRRLCAEVGIVVLSGPSRSDAVEDAVTVTQWAVDHAQAIGADGGRVLVGGAGFGDALAAAVARHARHNGWPPIERQVLIDPTDQAITELVADLRRSLSTTRSPRP